MKKTLTIYFFSLSSLFLTGCGDSFFKDIKNNEIKRVKQVKELVNQGANIHYKDRGGNSLLHVVGSVELAEFFLKRGLNIEARNNRGEISLYTAIERGHYDVALFLSKRRFHAFAETNNGDNPHDLTVRLLLQGNLSPEDRKLLDEILDVFVKENAIKN